MAPGIGIGTGGLGGGFRFGAGSGGGPPALITLPTTPTARWHAQHSTVTTSGGRVTQANDIQGLANATEGAAGVGPLELTDGLGRKFWRFTGAEYLNIAGALVADQRGITVFVVGRMHRAMTGNFFGLGNVAQGTTQNTQGSVINTSVSGNLPPYLRGTSTSASSDATNKAKVIVGSQLQVMGVASRPTASGAQRLYLNNGVASVVQSAGALTGVIGAEIGRYPFSAGTSGTWLLADIYEIAVFVGVLTDGQADAIAAALVSGWSIPAVTNQAVLDGDSITQGTGTVTVGNQISMRLTEPGGAHALPGSWRVVSVGVSGNTVASLVTRRDAANTMYDNLLAGRNVVACQIGRNDLPTKTGAQVYAEIIALINTTTTGYLQRGWEVRQAVNIAVSASINTANSDLRTLLRAAQFKTDTLTGAGQAFDGKLGIMDLPLITSGASGTIFDTTADAGDVAWFQGDNTHPTEAGVLAMVTGGDLATAANGYSARIQAAA